MIIRISKDGSRSLTEADLFKSFKIVVSAGVDRETLDRSLKGVATLSDDAVHAWISPDDFIAQEAADRGAEWASEFRAMVESARKYGFVDPESGAVRVHIEVAAV